MYCGTHYNILQLQQILFSLLVGEFSRVEGEYEQKGRWERLDCMMCNSQRTNNKWKQTNKNPNSPTSED